MPDYLRFLVDEARSEGIKIEKFENLSSIVALLDMEKDIDFKKADTEREYLIDQLNASLSQRGLERLAMKTLEFSRGDMTMMDFYNYLFKKARLAGVDFSDLPNLMKYSEYIEGHEAIDRRKLFDEMASLGEKLMMALSENDDQRDLFQLSKDLSIVDEMFQVKLVRKEYDYYTANKDNFKVERFVSFIEDRGPEYGLDIRIPEKLGRLDAYRVHMAKFYGYSLERDDVFVEKMDSKLNEENKDVAILVTGGFHTSNLSGLLKDEGYSYIQVLPKLKTEPDCPYFSLLAGEPTEMEEFIGELMAYRPGESTLATQSLFSEMGIDPAATTEDMIEFEVQLRRYIQARLRGEDVLPFRVLTNYGVIEVEMGEVGGADFTISEGGVTLSATVDADADKTVTGSQVDLVLTGENEAALLNAFIDKRGKAAGVKEEVLAEQAVFSLQSALRRLGLSEEQIDWIFVTQGEKVLFWNESINDDELLEPIKGHAGGEHERVNAATGEVEIVREIYLNPNVETLAEGMDYAAKVFLHELAAAYGIPHSETAALLAWRDMPPGVAENTAQIIVKRVMERGERRKRGEAGDFAATDVFADVKMGTLNEQGITELSDKAADLLPLSREELKDMSLLYAVLILQERARMLTELIKLQESRMEEGEEAAKKNLRDNLEKLTKQLKEVDREIWKMNDALMDDVIEKGLEARKSVSKEVDRKLEKLYDQLYVKRQIKENTLGIPDMFTDELKNAAQGHVAEPAPSRTLMERLRDWMKRFRFSRSRWGVDSNIEDMSRLFGKADLAQPAQIDAIMDRITRTIRGETPERAREIVEKYLVAIMGISLEGTPLAETPLVVTRDDGTEINVLDRGLLKYSVFSGEEIREGDDGVVRVTNPSEETLSNAIEFCRDRADYIVERADLQNPIPELEATLDELNTSIEDIEEQIADIESSKEADIKAAEDAAIDKQIFYDVRVGRIVIDETGRKSLDEVIVENDALEEAKTRIENEIKLAEAELESIELGDNQYLENYRYEYGQVTGQMERLKTEAKKRGLSWASEEVVQRPGRVVGIVRRPGPIDAPLRRRPSDERANQARVSIGQEGFAIGSVDLYELWQMSENLIFMGVTGRTDLHMDEIRASIGRLDGQIRAYKAISADAEKEMERVNYELAQLEKLKERIESATWFIRAGYGVTIAEKESDIEEANKRNAEEEVEDLDLGLFENMETETSGYKSDLPAEERRTLFRRISDWLSLRFRGQRTVKRLPEERDRRNTGLVRGVASRMAERVRGEDPASALKIVETYLATIIGVDLAENPTVFADSGLDLQNGDFLWGLDEEGKVEEVHEYRLAEVVEFCRDNADMIKGAAAKKARAIENLKAEIAKVQEDAETALDVARRPMFEELLKEEARLRMRSAVAGIVGATGNIDEAIANQKERQRQMQYDVNEVTSRAHMAGQEARQNKDYMEIVERDVAFGGIRTLAIPKDFRDPRGYHNLPNDDYTPGIRNALVKREGFAACKFQDSRFKRSNLTLDGPVTDEFDETKEGVVPLADQMPLRPSQMDRLNRLVSEMGIESLLTGTTLIFINGQSAHYGVKRNQLYLGTELLNNVPELRRQLTHELLERRDVVKAKYYFTEEIETAARGSHDRVRDLIFLNDFLGNGEFGERVKEYAYSENPDEVVRKSGLTLSYRGEALKWNDKYGDPVPNLIKHLADAGYEMRLRDLLGYFIKIEIKVPTEQGEPGFIVMGNLLQYDFNFMIFLNRLERAIRLATLEAEEEAKRNMRSFARYLERMIELVERLPGDVIEEYNRFSGDEKTREEIWAKLAAVDINESINGVQDLIEILVQQGVDRKSERIEKLENARRKMENISAMMEGPLLTMGENVVYIKAGPMIEEEEMTPERAKERMTEAGQNVLPGMHRNLFKGEECFDYKIGADPKSLGVGSDVLVDTSMSGARSATDDMIETKRIGNVTTKQSRGTDNAIEMVSEIIGMVTADIPVPTNRIHCGISATQLQEINRNKKLVALLASPKIVKRLGAKYPTVRGFLGENVLLDEIRDQVGLKVYPLPYAQLSYLGLSRLNIAHVMETSPDDEEAVDQAILSYAWAMGLVSNNIDRVDELFAKLKNMADMDRDFFRRVFQIALPAVAKEDMEEMWKIAEAEKEVLRAL